MEALSSQRSTESLVLIDSENTRPAGSEGRLGNKMDALMLFKSCVGLCVFTYPYAFAKVGVIWGVALSAIVC